jgi:hypothetical protein
LASELNRRRFEELSTIDPSFPDVTIASPDTDVHTVVAEVISSISSSKLIYKWRQKKQDRQCTYNVTLRRVRATIVAVEKK